MEQSVLPTAIRSLREFFVEKLLADELPLVKTAAAAHPTAAWCAPATGCRRSCCAQSSAIRQVTAAVVWPLQLVGSLRARSTGATTPPELMERVCRSA